MYTGVYTDIHNNKCAALDVRTFEDRLFAIDKLEGQSLKGR